MGRKMWLGGREAIFHPDVIQVIVSKYSSELFAIDVRTVQFEGQWYPIITIPPGVRTPVAAKADLKAADGKPLLREHAVYVRSLSASGTYSSSEARRGDWEDLTRTCFNNREADIGSFVRRHLSALDFEALESLVPFFAKLHRPTSTERIPEERNGGWTRFTEACREAVHGVPDIGYRESVVIVEGEVPAHAADNEFRDRLLGRVQDTSGWPPFVDFSRGGRESDRPYVLDNGWQALVTNLPPEMAIMGHHLDFWRIDPRGVFYHVRGLEDDLNDSRGVAPREGLELLIQMSSIAEIISTALSFGRSLGCKEDVTSLIFGFRWTKLRGRMLTSWTDPRMGIRQPQRARQDVYASTPIVVPLETSRLGIAAHVVNVVKPLFNLFGGFDFDTRIVERVLSTALRWPA
jgi:hypothetical protein